MMCQHAPSAVDPLLHGRQLREFAVRHCPDLPAETISAIMGRCFATPRSHEDLIRELEAEFIGRHIGEFEGIRPTQRDVRVPYAVGYDLRDGRITRVNKADVVRALADSFKVPLSPEEDRRRRADDRRPSQARHRAGSRRRAAPRAAARHRGTGAFPARRGPVGRGAGGRQTISSRSSVASRAACREWCRAARWRGAPHPACCA